MKYVIFHGSFGQADGNWFPELKERLERLGQDVILKQFPIEDWNQFTKKGRQAKPSKQNLSNWLAFFQHEIMPSIKRQKICFIGHSSAPVFILHILNNFDTNLDCAVFVSPFLRRLENKIVPWQYDLVNSSFYKTNFDFDRLKRKINCSYVLYSRSDPYVPAEYALEFATKMDSSVIEIQNAGHLNSEVNLNAFPLVLELCKSRLDLSLYQKYLAHRRGLFALDYIEGKNEEIIYLTPTEVFDEGVFHFRNLRKSGFCTLYTGTKFWDKQSKYMDESRKAAKRMANVTRVYVVEKLKDLNRVGLRQQINMDINSCIDVYLVVIDKLRDSPEKDFGIWDEDYTCYVHFDNKKQASEVRLSSRQKDIKNALIWQRKILKIATKIPKITVDIDEFIKAHTKK